MISADWKGSINIEKGGIIIPPYSTKISYTI